MAAADSQVEVKIVGRLDGSVQTSVGVAKQQIAGLADASTQLGTSLQQEAAAWTATRTATAGATEALNEATAASTATHGSISVATREFRALFDELSSGRTRMVPGTMAIIAQRVLGLGPAALIAGGAIAALVGSIAYFMYQALEARKNIDGLTEGFALTGRGATMSGDAVKYNLGFLSQIPGSSSAAANAFMHLAATHASWSAQLVNETGQLLPAFIGAYGKDAPQAVGKLTESLSDLTLSGFQKLDKEMLGLNPTQYETIENLIKTGSTAQAVSMILQALSKNSGVYIKSLGDQVFDIEQTITKLKAAMAAPDAYNDQDPIAQRQRLLDLEKQLAAVRQQEATAGQTEANNAYKEQLDDAQKINDDLDKRGPILTKITQLTEDMASAQKRGDTQGANTFLQAKQAEVAKLAQIDNEEADKGYQAWLAGETAKSDASKAGSAARIQIAEEEVTKAGQEFGKESKQYAEAMANLNTQRREAAQEAERIQEEANRKFIEQLDQASAEFKRIRQDDLRSDLEIAQYQFDAKKQELDKEVAQGKITNAEKIAQLKQLMTDEVTAQITELQAEASAQGTSISQYNEYMDRIKVLRAKLAADLAQLDTEGADSFNNSVGAQLRAWRSFNNEVMRSENTLVQGIFSGRTNLTQALEQLVDRQIEAEIEGDLRYLTEKLLLNAEVGNSDKMTEQGGLLAHLFAEENKTAATVAGNAERTTATAAGATAQTAVSAQGFSVQITNDAKVAAANVYATVSEIPVVGPVLAPVAAAAAFAGVMAFDSIASLDTGTNQVPNDMLALIHQNERIIPAADNSDLMSALSSVQGGDNTENNQGGDSNITMNISVQAPAGQDPQVWGRQVANAIYQQVRNGNSQIRDAVRGY